jgi:SAM-dependent methyltransferase
MRAASRSGNTVDDDFWQALPLEVEVEAYRSLYPDLARMSDGELLNHYNTYGRVEGRTGNRLRDRNDFAELIPRSANVLEIGPFCNPLLRGPNVSYFDVLSQDELITRARLIGLDAAEVPYIDFVSPTSDLSIVNRHFDVVVSSHCLEHQPDLVSHLQDVGRLLRPGGAYFLLVPDKRYCFDHYIPLSSLAEIMIARHERRKAHTLRSVIEHRALITHNDSLRHWQGDHGVMFENFEQRLRAALREFDDVKGGYIDVHAWYFTYDSASAILAALQHMRLIQFATHRVYAPRHGSNEFWMILRA